MARARRDNEYDVSRKQKGREKRNGTRFMASSGRIWKKKARVSYSCKFSEILASDVRNMTLIEILFRFNDYSCKTKWSVLKLSTL